MSQRKSGMNNLVLITQLGINVMTPVFLCLMVGILIDRRFGTSTVLVFLIVGVLSGGLSAYKLAKRTIDQERVQIEKEEAERRKSWEERFGTEAGPKAPRKRGW